MDVFEREIIISHNDDYRMPEPEAMFTGDEWVIDKLLEQRETLNFIKSGLNKYVSPAWQSHTDKMNRASGIKKAIKTMVRPELPTQAWSKFYEIASSHPLIPLDVIKENNNSGFTSIHLCEAPGAFVTSLNHWLRIHTRGIAWRWIATTLNPYYEGNSSNSLISDDRFIRFTLNNWFFGKDYTGDIMHKENLDQLIEISQRMDNDVLLVTADGSIDCFNVPSKQEMAVNHLQFCEVVAALCILNVGGSFLLKIFTMFEHQTVCLLYLLACAFLKVVIKKPATSKPGNSEMYVMCFQFKGRERISPQLSVLKQHYENKPDKPMFRREHIPQLFQKSIIKCSDYFVDRQCAEILQNTWTYKTKKKITKDFETMRNNITMAFCDKYKAQHLSSCFFITGKYLANVPYPRSTPRGIWDSYDEYLTWENSTASAQLSYISTRAPQFNETVSLTITSKNMRTISPVYGKPYKRIRNSMFCDQVLLKYYNILLDILETNNIKVPFPCTDNLASVRNRGFQGTHIKFQYSSVYSGCKVYGCLINLISKMKYKQSIYLTGYSLLTQANVGFLYILAHLFQRILIVTDETAGYVIYLNNYENNEDRMRRLKGKLKKAFITEMKEEDKAIISLIRISEFNDSCLFSPIRKLNNMYLSIHIQYMARYAQEHLGTQHPS